MPFIAPLLLGTVLVAGPSGACPSLPVPTIVHVNVVIDPPRFDHTRSLAQLTHIKPLFNPYGRDSKGQALGLTEPEFKTSLKSTIILQGRSDLPTLCAWYKDVSVTLQLKTTIAVAREIPSKTCWYRETLNHERKHFNVAYDVISDYRTVFEKELNKELVGIPMAGPFPANNQDRIATYLKTRLANRAEAIADHMHEEGIKRQLTVDTIAEYERVAAICRKEDNDLIL